MRAFARPRCAARAALLTAALFAWQSAGPAAAGYSFNYQVADMRQPANISGGTACPQPTRQNISEAGGIPIEWSTSLGTNPATILTANQTPAGQLAEIAGTIAAAYAIWTGVSGTTLAPSVFAPLGSTTTQDACSPTDGIDSICFNQSDAAFTTGVLSFTRVTTTDAIGQRAGPGTPAATFIGQILDADILLLPGDSGVAFATPAALAANPSAYDLESVLGHEIGHTLGLGHSGVWRAMMSPFGPAPGTYLGTRPTVNEPDAPLADDDRAGLRALYPDASDTTHVGTISGRVLPANPLSLPPGTTGVFGAQVVAVDAGSGAVEAAALGGWSCVDPGPAQFDGSYTIEKLAVGAQENYVIYAEPLDGPLEPSDVPGATTALCRNALTDPGWPEQFACASPPVATGFSTTMLSGP
ncbi:MAG: matrixin family metalloprotease [Candidatus Acidiferrales bacterium]